MFNILSWYIIFINILCVIVALFSKHDTAEKARISFIGIMLQCVPMFMLAGHVLGWF